MWVDQSIRPHPYELDKHTVTSDHVMTQMMEMMSQHQNQAAAALTLPRPEVPMFTGDPLEYCDFF